MTSLSSSSAVRLLPTPRSAPDHRIAGRLVFTVAAVGAYAATLRWVYSVLIAPLFSYAGYSFEPGPWQVEVLTVIMTALVALLLPRAVARPSHAVLWVLFVVCVAPTMLVSTYCGYLQPGRALLLSLVVGCAFAVPAAGVRRGPMPARDLEGDVLVGTLTRTKAMWALVAAHSAVTYGLLITTVGLKFQFVALTDVYDVRAEYSSDLGAGGLLGYVLSGQANVVNTLVMARALARRQWALLALVVVAQLLLYTSTGFKTILFSFPAVLLIALLLSRRRVTTSTAFLVGPALLMLVAGLADQAQDGILWTSLFSRRFIVTPGLLGSAYTAFFSDNPHAFYGHSFLKGWVDYPYDRSPAKLIGQFLSQGSEANANAHVFADGFANLGWPGVLMMGVVLLVLLLVVDRATRGLPLVVSGMVLLMPSITLSNTSLFTAMLSHGILVALVLLAVAPRTGWRPAIHD